MKKNILFFTTLMLIVFSSCDRKAEFKSVSFVTLENTSYSVGEDAETLKIPVTIYNASNQEVQVIVKVSTESYDDNKKAEEDKNFRLSKPQTGVLTFAPGETTKDIELEILHDPAQTGSKYLDITIQSADEDFITGNINKTSCRIRDLEHPLKEFIGDWTGEVEDYWMGPTTLTMSIAEDQNDDTGTKLRISNIDPISATLPKAYSVKAVANEEKTAITIANDQPVGKDEQYGYYSLVAVSITANGMTYADPLTLTYSESNGQKKLAFSGAYGTIASGYIMTLYLPGIVLTKK